VAHFLGDGRHRQHLFLIKGGEEEKLREGNVARRELFAEMEDETTLQLHDDVRQTFGVGPEFVRRLVRSGGGYCGIQPTKL
jgi:hypothetical protein